MFATLIKIKNSKIHDQQLKLTRSSIKNKLFEISKEFKDFKLKQYVRTEFTEKDEVFKNKIFADPRFNSEKNRV